MRITLNGESRDVPDGATVADILRAIGAGAIPAAVERNGEIVPRSVHATTPLADGDRLEIVTMVGGG